MSYTEPITRVSPTTIIFVIDQSGSMADQIPNSDPPQRKCDVVADVVNNTLRNLSMKCVKEEAVGDYFHIGVIGYGASVGSAWAGILADRNLIPISELASSPVKIETRNKKVSDGAGGLVEQSVKFPVWFEPVANGGTPMCGGLKAAHRLVDQWINDHPICFPPTVIHITDGESTDSKDRDDANRLVGKTMSEIKSLRSNDGNVLLFNIHLSSNKNAHEIRLPADSNNLPDEYSRTLFDGASELTPNMRSRASEEHGISASDGSKCFALNADLSLLFQCIDIGTQAANMR